MAETAVVKWQVAKDGKPVSPEFSSWREAAQWAVVNKLASFEPFGKCKGVWLVRDSGIEVWDRHQIAEHEELLAIL